MKTKTIILIICLLAVPSLTNAKTLTPREQRILEIKQQISELKAELKLLNKQKDSKEDIKKAKKTLSFDELSEKFQQDYYEMSNTLIASKRSNFKDSKFYTKKVPTIQDQITLYQKFVDDALALDNLTKEQIDGLLSYMETKGTHSSVFSTYQSPSDKLIYQKKLMDRLEKLKK